jgi:hypothetical protein
VTDDAIREIRRSRWRREREKLGLADVHQQEFAKGGLGQYVPNLSLRLVILAVDPECELVNFDEEFWSWWKIKHESPFGGPPDDTGGVIPTTNAAVRYDPLSDKPWSWDSYIALCRHGGLDMGLGHDGAGATQEGKRIFWLVRIVGRLWNTLHFYREAVERCKISGPWECSVSLLGTQGGSLGNFATGWVYYTDTEANPYPCPEPNLCKRWELDEWPAVDATRDLAFGIGGWIENSWGMQLRRFIARSGRFEGQFDISCYR